MRSLTLEQIENQSLSTRDLSWEAIRTRTSHWITDFEFVQFEIVFLQHLVARATLWVTKPQNEILINDLVRKLENLELRRDLFVRILKYHRIQIESVIENPFAHDGQIIRQDHNDLEKRIIEFTHDFRMKKCAIYLLVENTVDREKIRRLFDSGAERHLIEYE